MRVYRSIEEAMASGIIGEATIPCPSPDHEDRSPSASVNTAKGLWVCYSCGAAGYIDVESYEISQTAVARHLAKLTHQLETENRSLTESWLSQYDASGPGEYWLSRFSAPVCRAFRLGMDYEANAATIPLRGLLGSPMGVIRRSLNEGETKYKYPLGVDVSKLIFNYHDCQGEIIVLTEGATDTIAAVEAGHEAMAIFGSNLSKSQRDAVVRYWPKALILAFDMDDAGERAARAATAAFPELVTVRARWDGYKDLASMPVEERAEVLSQFGNEALSRLDHTSPVVLAYETCESELPTSKSNSTRQSPTSTTRTRPGLKLKPRRD